MDNFAKVVTSTDEVRDGGSSRAGEPETSSTDGPRDTTAHSSGVGACQYDDAGVDSDATGGRGTERIAGAWTRRRKLTATTLLTVYVQCQGICGICDLPVPAHLAVVDHVVPLARGGADDLTNWQLAHDACNRWKHDRLQSELQGAYSPSGIRLEAPDPSGIDPWDILLAIQTLQDRTAAIQAQTNIADSSRPDMDMTVMEAAAALGITERAVRMRIAAGTLKARRMGPMWAIAEREVKRAQAEPVPIGPRRKAKATQPKRRRPAAKEES